MDGQVAIDRESRPLRGVLVLLIALALGAMYLLIVNVQVIVSSLVLLLLSLLPLILVVVIVLASVQRVRGAARAGSGLMMRAAGLAAVGGVKGAYGAGRAASGRVSAVTVRRFRIRALTGELVPCVLYGDPLGDDIRHGDVIRASGGRSRDGHLLLTGLEVLDGPSGSVVSVIRTRGGRLHRALVTGDRIALGISALIVVATAVGYAKILITG